MIHSCCNSLPVADWPSGVLWLFPVGFLFELGQCKRTEIEIFTGPWIWWQTWWSEEDSLQFMLHLLSPQIRAYLMSFTMPIFINATVSWRGKDLIINYFYIYIKYYKHRKITEHAHAWWCVVEFYFSCLIPHKQSRCRKGMRTKQSNKKMFFLSAGLKFYK